MHKTLVNNSPFAGDILQLCQSRAPVGGVGGTKKIRKERAKKGEAKTKTVQRGELRKSQESLSTGVGQEGQLLIGN